MDNLIAKLYQSPKTILTNKDLSLLWEENDSKSLNGKTAYYVKQKLLLRLTRGIFAKNRDYNPKELANSIYAPSYISFETALREAGVIFQHYDTIFVASKWPREIRIGNNKIHFRKLKDEVLFNPEGVVNQEGYSMASKERAFLDMIYLFPNYYFDNLRTIDWLKCAQLVKLYNNKQMIKRLRKYQKQNAE